MIRKVGNISRKQYTSFDTTNEISDNAKLFDVIEDFNDKGYIFRYNKEWITKDDCKHFLADDVNGISVDLYYDVQANPKKQSPKNSRSVSDEYKQREFDFGSGTIKSSRKSIKSGRIEYNNTSGENVEISKEADDIASTIESTEDLFDFLNNYDVEITDNVYIENGRVITDGDGWSDDCSIAMYVQTVLDNFIKKPQIKNNDVKLYFVGKDPNTGNYYGSVNRRKSEYVRAGEYTRYSDIKIHDIIENDCEIIDIRQDPDFEQYENLIYLTDNIKKASYYNSASEVKQEHPQAEVCQVSEDTITSAKKLIKSSPNFKEFTADDIFDKFDVGQLTGTVFMDREECKNAKCGMEEFTDLMWDVVPTWLGVRNPDDVREVCRRAKNSQAKAFLEAFETAMENAKFTDKFYNSVRVHKKIQSELNHFYDPATDYIDEELTEDEEYKYSQFKVETGYYLTPQRARIDVYTVYSPNGKYLGQTSNPNKILDLIRGKRVNSSRRIQSMRTPKNVYLNEDTQKLIQRLEKRVGHELKLKFEEGNIPYVEIEKLPKGGYSFITDKYLNNLAEHFLYDGYKEKQDFFIVYLDPAIMYTRPGIKSSRRNNMIKSSLPAWAKSLSDDDAERRNQLQELYNEAHWEFLDYIMPCDPEWTPDMADGDFNPLNEIHFLFENAQEIESFLANCDYAGIPGAEEKLKRMRQINTWNEAYASGPYPETWEDWSSVKSSKQIKSTLDTVKVTFDNGDTIVTDYNADVGREEIAKYYMHNYFNVGGEDEMHQVVKVEFPGNINSARVPEKADLDMAYQLEGYIESDHVMYDQLIVPVIKNLERKMKRGIFDYDKSLILWQHVADEGAKRYVKELGGPSYNVATRKEVAKNLAEYYKENYDVNGDIYNPIN